MTQRQIEDLKSAAFFIETMIHLRGELFDAHNRVAYAQLAERLRATIKENSGEANPSGG